MRHYCEKNVPLETYEQHLRDCYRMVEESGGLLEMPEEGAVMEFKSWQNAFMLPCFGSADFEACVVKEVGIDIETIKQRLLNDKEREEGSTINVARHEPNSVGFNFVDTNDFSKDYNMQLSGDNFLTEWFIYLFKLAHKCVKTMKQNEPMDMTEEDERNFRKAKCCHIC